MYWFEIQEILEEKDHISSKEIFIKYLERNGNGNRGRIVKVLNKLVLAGIVEMIEVNNHQVKGRHFIYVLKK